MNEEAGIVWPTRIFEHFRRVIWWNPEPERGWEYTRSTQIVLQKLGPRMFPLTLSGVAKGIDSLRHWQCELAKFRLQLLGEFGEIDDCPLVSACADHLGAVHRPDRKLDMSPIDLRNFRFAGNAPARRSRGNVTNIDSCTDRSFTRIEIGFHCIERRVLHDHDHDGCRQDRRQHRVLESIGEVFGGDDETERAFGSKRYPLHGIPLA